MGVLRAFVALTTTIAFLATGCAGERPWPAHPVALSAQAFATRGEIGTVDVLPLDLQLWAERGHEGNLAELRAGAEVNIMNAVLDALARRSYSVGAMIDWNGDFPGGNALSRDDLLATVGSLARYGAAAAEHPGQLPVPFLPARLGTATGADATLYVGGWAYVARHRESTGEQVAKGVMIGLLVLGVVAIVALVLSGSKSHGRGGGGRGGGGRGASGSGHAADMGRGASQAAFHAGRGAHHAGRRAAEGLVDAFGRTAIDIAVASPDWSENPALPHEGGEPAMYLEMTLVDNRTGLALWHVHQTFPASAASATDTARVARSLLEQLPGRVVQPPVPAAP